ncbi:hypothetical protein, partial [Micromonospora sp. RV43]|uniref:hypothetical protein n=1 Tax=Micromonospora sp. RV43 TaxID=1661387 RepID=UPI00064C2707
MQSARPHPRGRAGRLLLAAALVAAGGTVAALPHLVGFGGRCRAMSSSAPAGPGSSTSTPVAPCRTTAPSAEFSPYAW